MGGLTFLFGSFVFAYFYLRSVNSNGRWHGSGFVQPSVATGTIIIALIVISAVSIRWCSSGSRPATSRPG